MKSASLLPTSARTVNSRASREISSRLTVAIQGDGAVGDLHVAQAQLAQPGDQPLDPALADRQLGEGAAEDHGYPVRGVALELGLQVGAHQRGAPAELDHVHAAPCHLQQAIDVGDRQAAVDHVGESPLAWLGRALGYVQEAGYGEVAALSRPTTTATLAEPARDAVADSIGCTRGNGHGARDAFGVGLVTRCVLARP